MARRTSLRGCGKTRLRPHPLPHLRGLRGQDPQAHGGEGVGGLEGGGSLAPPRPPEITSPPPARKLGTRAHPGAGGGVRGGGWTAVTVFPQSARTTTRTITA